MGKEVKNKPTTGNKIDVGRGIVARTARVSKRAPGSTLADDHKAGPDRFYDELTKRQGIQDLLKRLAE